MTDLPFSGTKRKKPPSFENGFMIQNQKRQKNGADDGARTRYLHLGKVALYQMSYIRIRSEEILFACLVPPVGIEPTTRGFSVLCSTN